MHVCHMHSSCAFFGASWRQVSLCGALHSSECKYEKWICMAGSAQAPTPCTFGPNYSGRKYNAEVRLPLDMQAARFPALASWLALALASGGMPQVLATPCLSHSFCGIFMDPGQSYLLVLPFLSSCC